VSGAAGVVAAAAAGGHTRFLKSDGRRTGSLWAWGSNAYATLGTGSSAVSCVPAPVKVLSNVTAIASSITTGLALTIDGAFGALMATGTHTGNPLLPEYDQSFPATSVSFIALAHDDFVAIAAANDIRLALRWDTTLFGWPDTGNGFVLGNGGGADDDPDGDGLTTRQEWSLGTDPWTADTNGDGISDGQAIATGRSATEADMDGDGVPNATEQANNTDPFRADTDNDTATDDTDCFPLDPVRTSCPVPQPGDTTPPTITLTEPMGATAVP